MNRRLRYFPIGVLLVFLGGCAAAAQGSSEKLKEAVFTLNEGVRWGRLQDVLAYISPDSQSHYLESHKGVGAEIQITGYDVVSTRLDAETNTAQIGVKFSWYRLDRMEAHDTIVLQRWEAKDRLWLLVSEEFKDGVPLGM
ncbi:MAG: hypothetical protein MUC50_08955 [Myxococcota bacterium]|jgi:hypothetical protein|nr:hypothetical protein [Myxococcota bacterium]